MGKSRGNIDRIIKWSVGKLDTTRKDLAVVIVDIALAPSAHVPISGLGT